MNKKLEFNYNLQKLCRLCYKKKRYKVFKENKCEHCGNCDINPVYVNPCNHLEFVRNFWNSGIGKFGVKVQRCIHENYLDTLEHSSLCTFAMNDFEYFIWMWMKNNGKFLISEIFNEFVAPFLFIFKPRLKPISLAKPPIIRKYFPTTKVIPQSYEENMKMQQEEKKKIYFCWFCLKNVTSEHEIQLHLSGSDHNSYYRADKSRMWFFKMPESKTFKICKERNCECYSPHSQDEYQEMMARIKYRNFNFKNFGVLNEKISPWPLDVKLEMLQFPNNIESYKKSIRINVKLILNGWTVNYINICDIESIPFFYLHDNRIHQKSHSLVFTSCSSDFLLNFNFDIEFFPLSCGTYIQRLEFGFVFHGKKYYCQKLIRVDVGSLNHLKEFKRIYVKYNSILKRDLEYDFIVPFSNPPIKETSNILTENLLRRVFQVVPNRLWLSTAVKPWNYCHWMKDMLVHEELEQQLMLSKLIYMGDMEISTSFTGEMFIASSSKLFGTIVFRQECHDALTRAFVIKNVNKVFLFFCGLNNCRSLYECDLVDIINYKVESRSMEKVTLCIPEVAVKNIKLKAGMVLKNIAIYFRFNRKSFICRHTSLEKIPHYDKLSYIPLCCPTFTRLPYGEDKSSISFNPILTLNEEQKRLPMLVLRHLKPDEIVLPFILNGAFGTGKSSIIAETVRNILICDKRNGRVLICTRSFSAGYVYLKMFQKFSATKNILKKIKMITSEKKTLENKRKKMSLQDDSLPDELFVSNGDFIKDCSYNIFNKTKVFITTLDNVVTIMTPHLAFFIDEDPMFNYIFVDEAAQVLEVDVISVYQFGNKMSKFIFAGDVFQIRPDYYNNDLKKFTVPIVSRLHIMYKYLPDYEICLKQVYRSHPRLVNYLSEAIYYDYGLTSNVELLFDDIRPMNFIDSNENGENNEEFDEFYSSFTNKREAKLIVKAFLSFLAKYKEKFVIEDRILICTPFYSQVRLIQGIVENKGHSKVLVELPSGIQGKEFGAVFISTVLTSNNNYKHPVHHATFHNNKNLINLVISRAKYYVEVVGDKQCLLNHECKVEWGKFFEFCSNLN